MKKAWILLCCGGLALIFFGAFVFSNVRTEAANREIAQAPDRITWERRVEVQVLVNGRPLEEYHARGRTYVEAIEGAEYEVSVRNPLPFRVAVALSVDGLNTIDARRTRAWDASKWVIEPYGTINISGWQMSSQRARRFYFTSERDSYGAKLGQTGNLGVISAVFFRERRSIAVPIIPPPRKHPAHEEDIQQDSGASSPSAGTSGEQASKQRQGQIAPMPDDDYAATGIGRSVHNDVRWVSMDLESRPAGDVTIRYEYYPALVRLGIIPRPYTRPDPLRRREGATGFEDRRFSPEP
jgi:hypothetical protein